MMWSELSEIVTMVGAAVALVAAVLGLTVYDESMSRWKRVSIGLIAAGLVYVLFALTVMLRFHVVLRYGNPLLFAGLASYFWCMYRDRFTLTMHWRPHAHH